MTDLVKIADDLYYLKAADEPLSADIGIVYGKEYTWIFDVGASDEAAAMITSLPGKKNVVLSHFHPDHIHNLSKINYHHLYVSAHTYKYTKCGEIVNDAIVVDDGVLLKIFVLPSSHAKGSIGLEVNEAYAFLGDGVYSQLKSGKVAYNANVLQAEIKLLKGLKASYFLLSHDKNFVCAKEKVIEDLEKIYALRDEKSAFIFISEDD